MHLAGFVQAGLFQVEERERQNKTKRQRLKGNSPSLSYTRKQAPPLPQKNTPPPKKTPTPKYHKVEKKLETITPIHPQPPTKTPPKQQYSRKASVY